MSETVKIIVTLSKGQYEALKDIQFGGIGSRMIFNAVKNGIPFDINSEKAEAQAYIAGESYGWEEGRKALIDDVKAEIKDRIDNEPMSTGEAIGMEKALDTIDKYKGDSEC